MDWQGGAQWREGARVCARGPVSRSSSGATEAAQRQAEREAAGETSPQTPEQSESAPVEPHRRRSSTLLSTFERSAPAPPPVTVTPPPATPEPEPERPPLAAVPEPEPERVPRYEPPVTRLEPLPEPAPRLPRRPGQLHPGAYLAVIREVVGVRRRLNAIHRMMDAGISQVEFVPRRTPLCTETASGRRGEAPHRPRAPTKGLWTLGPTRGSARLRRKSRTTRSASTRFAAPTWSS